MKKVLFTLALLFIVAASITSCHKDDIETFSAEEILIFV